MKNIIFHFLFALIYPKEHSRIRETASLNRQYYDRFFSQKELDRVQAEYPEDIIYDDPVWIAQRQIDAGLLKTDYHLRRH